MGRYPTSLPTEGTHTHKRDTEATLRFFDVDFFLRKMKNDGRRFVVVVVVVVFEHWPPCDAHKGVVTVGDSLIGSFCKASHLHNVTGSGLDQ